MDALALLCNLYGDGPATLQRLKSAGFSSVESLDDIGASGLADTLETTEAAARRFLREARLLGERMVESGFEDEASPPIATPSAGPVPIVELEERARTEPLAEPIPEQPVELVREAPVPWDAEQGPPAEELPNAPQEPDALVGGTWDERPAEPSEQGEAPDSTEEESDTGLELRVLDGLSRAWCAAFSKLGLRTIEDLAEMDTLYVSEQLGEGLTRLDRFRFLARRHLSELPAEAASEAVLVPRPARDAEPAPRGPGGSGSAGPSGALGTEPWPAAPAETVKFSLAGTPFSRAKSPLASDLERAEELRDADAGTAGPFS